MTQMILADDPCRYQKGFTLVELAVVLLIVALLLTGLLGPLSTRVEQQERQRTEAVLEGIKEALYGFAIANGRLPCPDTDGDGRENPVNIPVPSATVCTDERGDIPRRDLAVPHQDVWGRNFVYRVTGSFADGDPNTPGPTPRCSLPVQASLSLCSDGDITITDCDPNVPAATCPLPSLGTVADRVPAVVISRGANRFNLADATAPEVENFEDPALSALPSPRKDTQRTIVSRMYTGAAGQEFDDLVVWLSPVILKNRMLVAGRLP